MVDVGGIAKPVWYGWSSSGERAEYPKRVVFVISNRGTLLRKVHVMDALRPWRWYRCKEPKEEGGEKNEVSVCAPEINLPPGDRKLPF